MRSWHVSPVREEQPGLMRRELEIGQGKDNEALSTERDSKRTRPDLNYYASSRPYSAEDSKFSLPFALVCDNV